MEALLEKLRILNSEEEQEGVLLDEDYTEESPERDIPVGDLSLIQAPENWKDDGEKKRRHTSQKSVEEMEEILKNYVKKILYNLERIWTKQHLVGVMRI
eukprot:UN27697